MPVSPPKSDIVCRLEAQVHRSFMFEEYVVALSSLLDGAVSAVDPSVVGAQVNDGPTGALVNIDDAHGLLRGEGDVL